MLPEHTATALPSASGAGARTWQAPAGWSYLRAVLIRLCQVVGAGWAEPLDEVLEPDPFATEMPFLTERWPADE